MVILRESLEGWKKLQAEMDEVFKKAKEERQPEIDRLVAAKKKLDAKIEAVQFSILAEVLKFLEERHKKQMEG